MGSGTYGHVPRVLRGGPFTISLVTHARGATLPPHRHLSATITVVLGGDYAESLEGGLDVLRPMSVTTKPPGTLHANEVGPRGARSLLMEVEAGRLDELGSADVVFAAPRVIEAGSAAIVAIQLVAELERPDELTPLALESLASEWFAAIGLESAAEFDRQAPGWLSRVRERVHATSVGDLRLDELSREAGRHGSLVARAFRRHYGMSIGDYARRLRLARAARGLALLPQASISRVALEAGYCEHSHMSHDFRSRTGFTPRRWRELVDSGRRVP